MTARRHTNTEQAETEPSGFEKRKEVGVVREFFQFLWQNKLWWMVPIILVFGLLVLLVVFAAQSGSAAPFIYTLF